MRASILLVAWTACSSSDPSSGMDMRGGRPDAADSVKTGAPGCGLAAAAFCDTGWRGPRPSTPSTIRALDGLQRSLLDAETGQRGFLLTGNEQYLQPFESGLQRSERELSKLEALLPPVEVIALRQLGRAKTAELRRTIDLGRGGQREAALAIVNSDIGKKLMDEVRALVARLSASEEAAQARTDEAASAGLTWSLVIDGVAGVGLALLLTWRWPTPIRRSWSSSMTCSDAIRRIPTRRTASPRSCAAARRR